MTGVLAAGTNSGRIELWKFSPVAGQKSPEPEDQWQQQTPSVVSGSIVEITVRVIH